MKPDSQSLKVYEEIRKKILANLLAPDARLKEAFWSQKLEVSRMGVREALNRLLGERLVRQGEKGGFYVASVSAEDIRQIRKLREILEVGALRLAFKILTPVHITRLQKICDDFSSMVEQGYYSGAAEADIKFHETLIEFSGNEKLQQAYMSANISLFQMRLGSAHLYLHDYTTTDAEHRKIVQFLKAGKLKQAENTLVSHFARGEAAVLDTE